MQLEMRITDDTFHVETAHGITNGHIPEGICPIELSLEVMAYMHTTEQLPGTNLSNFGPRYMFVVTEAARGSEKENGELPKATKLILHAAFAAMKQWFRDKGHGEFSLEKLLAILVDDVTRTFTEHLADMDKRADLSPEAESVMNQIMASITALGGDRPH